MLSRLFVFTNESSPAACSSMSDECSDTINQWKEVTISLYQLGDGSFQMQAQLHQQKRNQIIFEKERERIAFTSLWSTKKVIRASLIMTRD